jgi:hypothetical integral membrane protein (TIGR02206 family)
MKDFLIYFFGSGNQVEFSIFTFAHLAHILWMIGMILLSYRFRDKLRQLKKEEMIRYAMAFILIISEMSYYWRLTGVTTTAAENLPFAVCGWAAIFCSYMVVGKNQTLFDICYFWLLSGSVFALLTPTPLTYTGPTRFRYYQFWTEHTMGYIAIFYMIFVHGMRPTVKSAVKSYVALLIFAIIAYWVNSMIPGANYLFLARPESAPSVLDILPPNFVLRTAIIAAVITAMYGLAYLPWYLKDKKAKKS